MWLLPTNLHLHFPLAIAALKALSSPNLVREKTLPCFVQLLLVYLSPCISTVYPSNRRVHIHWYSQEVIGSRKFIGEGATFWVERAQWKPKNVFTKGSEVEKRWGKFVALKHVKPRKVGQANDWRNVLLKIRSLLHEPLRYHPNIVHLLGLSWESGGTGANYPMLIVEYSSCGHMRTLQEAWILCLFRPSKSFVTT